MAPWRGEGRVGDGETGEFGAFGDGRVGAQRREGKTAHCMLLCLEMSGVNMAGRAALCERDLQRIFCKIL